MEIQEIKEQLSILTVLDHYGIKPNRSKMVNCPFQLIWDVVDLSVKSVKSFT